MSDTLSSIVNEDLNKNNFQAWKFRMITFLNGKGYCFWEFISGDEKEAKLLEENPTPQ